MAKRLALIPEEWLNSMPVRNKQTPDSAQQRPEITVAVPVAEETPKLEDIANMLPKRMQSRCRILLHYLEGHLKLSPTHKVIYADGEIGSHIIDLLRYFLSQFVTDRPLDAPKFTAMMQSIGVPNSVLAKRINSSAATQWKKL